MTKTREVKRRIVVEYDNKQLQHDFKVKSFLEGSTMSDKIIGWINQYLKGEIK